MPMIGQSSPIGKYDPSQLSRSDKLMLIGAMLHDAGNALRGGESDSVLNTQGMLAARQQYALQRAAMGKMMGLFGGQAAYQDGPSPSVSAPAVPGMGGTASPDAPPAPPMGPDDLSGAMRTAAASAAPGPAPEAPKPYVYTPPVMTSTGQASLSDPDTQRTLMAAAMYGVPGSKEAIDLLDKAQPHVVFGPDGTAINDKSAANIGKIFPKLDAGILAQRDAQGNLTGAAPLPGYADAAATIAGATTGAQEQQKAAWDLVDVPLSNGSTTKLPRAIAAPLLARRALALSGGVSGGATVDAGGGGGGGSAAGGADFGVSQTPAAAEIAKARAATQGKNESDVAGARSAMQQVDDQTNMIAQNLHDMLGETQDPGTGKWVKTKPSMITHLSTGSGTDVIEHVPFVNQQAKDLGAKIETVRNGTSFNSLQAIKNALAAAGDGGSGSIRMTDQTARMLGEINGSLNQDQSGPQFEATVRRHLAQLDALNKARHELFGSQYQGIRSNTPGQTGPTANYNKPAPQSSPRVPQPGAVVRGYKFLGGNPADPASWVKN